eukprot:TRINITY_DN1545_c0_g1_i1.p1 TRINITY_DN1545_c0_g1~~TRINITY_DN1545_c0_g1_i1.p1  ORF type:complete len:272 (-),score=87.76 TRINITY_DN1545_c0_g1_i1:98-856(-)
MAQTPRDNVADFVTFLGKTAGRDKLCRTIQYSAKFFKWLAEVELAKATTKEQKLALAERVAVAGNVYGHMSMARKALRFFRTIGVIQDLKKIDPSRDVIELSRFISTGALGLYFFFDFFMWLKKAGVVNFSPETTTRLDRLTEGSWLVEILFTYPVQLFKLMGANERLNNLKKRRKTVPAAELQAFDAKNQKEYLGARLERLSAQMALIKITADLPIALHFLGYGSSIPHGVFGLLGVVSSLIGCWEAWPSA